MNIINDIISWGITGILGFIVSTIFYNRKFIYSLSPLSFRTVLE